MTLNTYLALAAIAALLVSPLLLVASPLIWLWLHRQKHRRAEFGLSVLLPFHVPIVAACAEAMVRGPEPEAGWARIAQRIDRYLGQSYSSRTWRVVLLYTLIEFIPWVTFRSRLSKMPTEARREFVDRKLSRTHGLFGLIALTRQLVRLSYYGEKQTQERIGYVPVERRGPMLRERRRAGRTA